MYNCLQVPLINFPPLVLWIWGDSSWDSERLYICKNVSKPNLSKLLQPRSYVSILNSIAVSPQIRWLHGGLTGRSWCWSTGARRGFVTVRPMKDGLFDLIYVKVYRYKHIHPFLSIPQRYLFTPGYSRTLEPSNHRPQPRGHSMYLVPKNIAARGAEVPERGLRYRHAGICGCIVRL